MSRRRRCAGKFESDVRADQIGEGGGMPIGGPHLKFGVALRAQADPHGVVARQELDPRDDLSVAAVQPLGEPHARAQHIDRVAPVARQRRVALVRLLRCAPPMVSRDEGDDLDLLGVEPAQIAVPDEVIGVLVVALVADVRADIVQQRAVLEPLAFA